MPNKDPIARKKYHRKYYLKHRKKLIEVANQWKIKHHKKVKKYLKDRYWANRESDLRRSKNYRIAHIDERKAYNRKYYLANAESIKRNVAKNQPKYRLRNRWREIKRRSSNPKHKSWLRYGGRGIKCLLTMDDMNYLWERDNGISLKRPTIDRIDNDGPSARYNCRFIEQSENSAKRHRDHKR